VLPVIRLDQDLLMFIAPAQGDRIPPVSPIQEIEVEAKLFGLLREEPGVDLPFERVHRSSTSLVFAQHP
jgi:hypothetical protein